MTPDDTFKGAIHATAASLFAIMAAYNGLRFVSTQERRHLVNVLLYAPLCVFEWTQVRRHWKGK